LNQFIPNVLICTFNFQIPFLSYTVPPTFAKPAGRRRGYGGQAITPSHQINASTHQPVCSQQAGASGQANQPFTNSNSKANSKIVYCLLKEKKDLQLRISYFNHLPTYQQIASALQGSENIKQGGLGPSQ
jgi:hypothetical protein